jgi:hypothetical protein
MVFRGAHPPLRYACQGYGNVKRELRWAPLKGGQLRTGKGRGLKSLLVASFSTMFSLYASHLTWKYEKKLERGLKGNLFLK